MAHKHALSPTRVNRELPPEYVTILSLWQKIASNLQALDIGLATLAEVALIALALFAQRLGRLGSTLGALIALLCLAAVVLFDFQAMARKARMASGIMMTAIASYKADPNFTIRDLNQECDAGTALMREIAPKVRRRERRGKREDALGR